MNAKMKRVNRKLAKATRHVKNWGIKSLLIFDEYII